METLYTQTVETTQRIVELGERWGDASSLNQARSSILEQAEAQRAGVMLFGAYNAGKSSIINALIGEAAAEIGDVPTTDSVQDYCWGGIVLQDTPGVNAPIEHERVTRQALMRADMVVFVIRAGNQDTREVYERLLSLIANGTPVLVVVNHESAGDETEAHRVAMLDAVNENLSRMAPDYGVSTAALQDLRVLTVQARTAMKGRLEDKARLVAFSGIKDLEAALEDWVVSGDAEKGRARALIRRVDDELVWPLMASLDEQRVPQAQASLDEAISRLREIEAQTNSLKSRMGSQAKALASDKKMELLDIIESGASAAQQEVRLGDVFRDAQATLLNTMLEELPDVQKQLTPSASPLQGTDELRAENTGKGRVAIDDVVQQLKEAAPKIPEDTVEKLLMRFQYMDLSGVPILDRLQVALQGPVGETIKRNGRYLGPAVAVGAVVFETAKAAYDEDKANQKRRAQENRKHQCLNTWCDQMARELSAQTDYYIDTVMGEVLSTERAHRDELLSSLDGAARARQALRDCQADLYAFAHVQ